MVKKAAQATPNEILRRVRQERGWTQKVVADRIGAPNDIMVTRWERGTAQPSAYYVEKLCQLFGTSASGLGLLPAQAEETSNLPEPTPPASREGPPTGTVTLLFTDIEGSTHLLQQLGKGYEDVLVETRHLLRTAFREYHGYEVDTQGDSFFVAFARASDAVAASVAAQRAIAGFSFPEGITVRVRMGMHTGQPRLAAEGYVGLDVNQAARIMSAGHGGQVLLSQATRDLAELDLPEGVTLRPLGEHRLKDLGYPVSLFQVVIPDLRADFPPLQTLNSFPNNLPNQLTSLVGREREVAEVCKLLLRADVHLVTLTGTGGIGKTRLSLQVAAEVIDRFPDGVFFVDLAPIRDPGLVAASIAKVLGLWETGDRPLLEQVLDYLREKRLLLLFDNFEQVVSAAPQLAHLLASCPRLDMLVTSRASLHLSGEHEYAVSPLAVPDLSRAPAPADLEQVETVRLFLQRAQAVKADFQLSEGNAKTIAEICVQLDGLPLAIELAAARIKFLPPQVLLKRLSRRLQILTGGAQDLPTRQQTLRNLLKWSYDLLNEAEQRLFQRLSVFAGGCTLEAVEAVCYTAEQESASAFDEVMSLLDKNLLQADPEGEEFRLRMLMTMREFGMEYLEEVGESETIHRAYAQYYLTLAEQAEPHLKRTEQLAWLAQLERELENVRAALQWFIEHEEGELALRLSSALLRFWSIRGYWSEGQRWLRAALAMQPSSQGSMPARAKALYAAGELAFSQHDHAEADHLLAESVALYRDLGDGHGLAGSLGRLGFLKHIQGEPASAYLPLMEECQALCRWLNSAWNLSHLLHDMGVVASEQGNLTQAVDLYQESLTLARETGDRSLMGNILNDSGYVAYLRGNFTQAATLQQEALSLARELGNKGLIGQTLNNLGYNLYLQGHFAQAATLVQEGLTLARELGNKGLLQAALETLGSISLAQGDLVQASSLFKEGLSLWEVGNKVQTGLHLIGLARVAVAQGKPRQAVRLLGAAETHMDVNLFLTPFERADYERTVESLRATLSESTFANAWEEGRTMELQDILAAYVESR